MRTPALVFSWYSMDLECRPVDRGPATKADALNIVSGYFARLKPQYASSEDSISETSFGFNRTEDEFLELCLFDRDQISIRYEFRMPRRILFIELPRVVQKEFVARSKSEVIAVIAAFFDMDSAAFREHLGV